MPTPTQVLYASLALVRDRKVGGNAHPSMLRGRFISASRLIQRTARDLIEEVLRDEPRDPREAHYGEDGNAKAAINLAAIRCQEPTLVVAIPGTKRAEDDPRSWTLDGHPDGIGIHREDAAAWRWTPTNSEAVHYAAVFENKAPMFEPGDAKVEVYYRQGLLYLAMLVQMHDAGVRVLAPAEWLDEEDPRRRTWALPDRLEPAQVVVCIQPFVAEKREQAFPVDRGFLAKALQGRLEKAAVVVRGIQAKDPDVGTVEWDAVKGKGLGEFDLKGAIPVLSDTEFVQMVAEERVLAAAKKQAGEAHDAAKAALETYLRVKGVEEATVPCDDGSPYRVVLQATKGGIRHFTVEDSVSLRVYGGPKKPKAEKVLITTATFAEAEALAKAGIPAV